VKSDNGDQSGRTSDWWRFGELPEWYGSKCVLNRARRGGKFGRRSGIWEAEVVLGKRNVMTSMKPEVSLVLRTLYNYLASTRNNK
jgi:hypothetical protein